MIPVIIMGGILTGWFTPTEAGMVASVYILLVLVPLLSPGHIRHLPRDFVYTGLLYSIPLALVAAASAFGWMLAYLRGPDIVSGWIELVAGNDGRIIMLLLVLLFIVIGDFMDAVPAIIIFMPIVIKLNELGNIKPLHMGVVLITTLVFGLITPPYGLSLLVASKFVGVPFLARRCMRRCRFTWCFSSRSASRCCFRTSCSICRSFCFRNRSAASRARPAQAISARRNSFRVRLDQFDPVAERIVDMAPVVAFDRLVFRDPQSGLLCFRHHAGEIVDDESRMRLARRNEILLDAEVNLQRAAFKPAAAARGKLRRLHLFREPEDAVIKRPRLVLPPGRHRNQNVIDMANWHSTPRR